MSAPAPTPPILTLLDTLQQAAKDLQASVTAQATTQAARIAAESADAAAVTDVTSKYGALNAAWSAVLNAEPTPTPSTAAAPPVLKFGK